MSAPLRLPVSRPGSGARDIPRPASVAARPPTDTLVIGVVGAGRAGRAFATALAAAGHEVVAVASRTPSAALRLARGLGARVATPAQTAARAADLLVIAVPDAAIAAVVAEVAPALRPGQVVAHLSGAHGIGVLAPVLARGADALALHPAMTFVGDRDDAARLTAGVTFGATASAGAATIAELLVTDLGGQVEWIAEADRVRYHAALAHGANHLVTLVNDAAELARRAGVADPAALLGPLLRAALANVLASGDAALTGPVARGDAATVRAHLADLAETAPEIAEPYRALARRTAERAAPGQDPAVAAALRAVLDGVGPQDDGAGPQDDGVDPQRDGAGPR